MLECLNEVSNELVCGDVVKTVFIPLADVPREGLERISLTASRQILFAVLTPALLMGWAFTSSSVVEDPRVQ